MPVITRKIEIILDQTGLSNEDCKEKYKFIYNINDNLYKVANRILNQLYLADEIDEILHISDQEYVDLKKKLANKKLDDATKGALQQQMQQVSARINEHRKEILQRPQKSFAYGIATSNNPEKIFGQILTVLKEDILSHYKTDVMDIKRGEKTISNYKKGMPIPFAFNQSIMLYYDEESKAFYLKWFNNIKFILHFGRDKSNNELVVKRCLGMSEDGVKYRACSSSIQIKREDNHQKIFLLLAIDIPQEKSEQIKGMVVGVDLGINVPAYVVTNLTPERKAIGNRETFLNERGAFQRRFKALQRLQSTNGGRGRKHKLEPLERLREAERNWVKTKNHLYSRDVVNFAIGVKASTIQMENLKNIGKDKEGEVKDTKKFLLRNWSYFELQKMIEYKASRVGIKVQYVNPAFTSQTCNVCGVVQPESRDSIHFVCQNPDCPNCGKEVHADYNGARNIAQSKNIVSE